MKTFFNIVLILVGMGIICSICAYGIHLSQKDEEVHQKALEARRKFEEEGRQWQIESMKNKQEELQKLISEHKKREYQFDLGQRAWSKMSDEQKFLALVKFHDEKEKQAKQRDLEELQFQIGVEAWNKIETPSKKE